METGQTAIRERYRRVHTFFVSPFETILPNIHHRLEFKTTKGGLAALGDYINSACLKLYFAAISTHYAPAAWNIRQSRTVGP